MRPYYFLASNAWSGTTEHRTLADAMGEFRRFNTELLRFGNVPIDALVYVAPSRADMGDYPEYSLAIGPRGGVRCEKCY